MLKFIEKDKKTKVLTQEEGIMLGYIDENNVFFPNNNMMFKIEWLEEVANYMRKHGIISYGKIVAHYAIKEVAL